MTKRFFSGPALLAFALAAVAAGLYYYFGDASAVVAMLGGAPGLMLAGAPVAVPSELRAVFDAVDSIEGGIKKMRGEQQAELVELRREIERVEAKGNLQGIIGTKDDDVADGRRIVKATPAERKAFGMFLRTGESRYATEAKAMQVGVPGDGGYAVPTWFDSMVYQVMLNATPLLDLVTRNTVSNFPARHIVSVGGSGSGWVGETGARPETDSPEIAIVENAGGDLYCFPKATQWALDDIRFNAEAWLSNEIGLEMASRIQAAIVTGNGINSPTGFLAAPNALTTDLAGRPFGTIQYLKTGVAAALPATTAALIDLLLAVVHSLNQRYRQGASWLMSTSVLGELRKAKDTTGRPVLLDSMVTGQPATLLGYAVHEVDVMPPLAANAFPIAFGNFKRGYVLDEHESGLRVIVDSLTLKPYVGFYSVRRVGGKPLDSNAIKLLRCEV